MVNVETWKNKAAELTIKLIRAHSDYESILNEWESARDEAGDPGKHDVDDKFGALSDARLALCSLKGGSKRKHRRTRKNRR
jgi:hypothetical protein